MKRFSIGAKIGGGYLVMGVLLVVSGLAGYRATRSVAQSLEFITGPVARTTAGVGQGIKGMYSQMLAVDQVLLGGSRSAQALLDEGAALTRKARAEIADVGLLATEHLADLDQASREFEQARDGLLQGRERYVASQALLSKNIDLINNLLTRVDEFASQRIVNAEWNADRTGDAGTRDTDEWVVTGATTESRLALMKRLYYFEQLKQRPDSRDTRDAANAALADL